MDKFRSTAVWKRKCSKLECFRLSVFKALLLGKVELGQLLLVGFGELRVTARKCSVWCMNLGNFSFWSIVIGKY